MKIDLPLFSDNYRCFFTTVEAELVNVAPHIAADFAVHRKHTGEWGVSEVSTGALVRRADSVSKAQSIRRARAYLLTKTQADFDEALKRIELEYPEATR